MTGPDCAVRVLVVHGKQGAANRPGSGFLLHSKHHPRHTHLRVFVTDQHVLSTARKQVEKTQGCWLAVSFCTGHCALVLGHATAACPGLDLAFLGIPASHCPPRVTGLCFASQDPLQQALVREALAWRLCSALLNASVQVIIWSYMSAETDLHGDINRWSIKTRPVQLQGRLVGQRGPHAVLAMQTLLQSTDSGSAVLDCHGEVVGVICQAATCKPLLPGSERRALMQEVVGEALNARLPLNCSSQQS